MCALGVTSNVKRVLIGGTLLFLSFVLFIPNTWLMAQKSSGDTVACFLLLEGDAFAIRFIHSVALTPVEEWFEAHEGHVALRRTVYEDFGAGLPHEALPGQSMTVNNGKIILTGYDLMIEKLHVRVGRVARHELLYPRVFTSGHGSILLETWEEQGKTLIFSIVSCSLAEVLWRYGAYVTL